MRSTIAALEAEYRRYKALGEGAMAQMDDGDLSAPGPNDGNSVAVIVWHIAGNFMSRFTDFLTTDGEKPWRQRDDEFQQRQVTRRELLEKWNGGWDVLFAALAALTDAELARDVTIRGQSLRVDAALYRSLAHASYHVGQIVYLAKACRGDAWTSLSIPKGQSQMYNRNPARDAAAGQAATLPRIDRLPR
jgi:hypothetical protein